MSDSLVCPDFRHVIAAVEAVLFATGRPVPVRNLYAILDEFEPAQVREAISALKRRYAGPASGIELVEVAGGLVFRTRPEQKRYVLKARQKSPARLSRAAMETLALVAYKQPVTRAEIEAIRGVDSSGTLRFLMERRLIRIQGRKSVPGRPLLYGTTRYFLELFQLKDLKSLPDSSELQELELLSKGQLNLFEKMGSGDQLQEVPADLPERNQQGSGDISMQGAVSTDKSEPALVEDQSSGQSPVMVQ